MITLIDSVTPGALPVGDFAYAGYVGGRFADFTAIEQRFPGHHVTSIAVNRSESADFADCEAGDFLEAEVVPWILRMHAEGRWRPGVYGSLEAIERLTAMLTRAIPRRDFRTWVADWNGRRDFPAGCDAHQYANDPAHDIDLSVCRDDFFPHHVRHPRPPLKGSAYAVVRFNTVTRRWNVEGQAAEKLPHPLP